MKKNEVDFFIYKANEWVTKRLPLFYKENKPKLEFLEKKLFEPRTMALDVNEFAPLVKYAESIGTDEVNYRQIEKIAILESLLPVAFDQEIDGLYETSFMHQYIVHNGPRLLWVDRDLVYAFTHTVFYVTRFGKIENETLYTDCSQNRFISMLSIGLLLACRRNDIDVLLELLCVIFILKIQNRLEQEVLELAIMKAVRSQAVAGDVSPGGNRTIESEFAEVYHTTLVATIFGVYYDNDSRNLFMDKY